VCPAFRDFLRGRRGSADLIETTLCLAVCLAAVLALTVGAYVEGRRDGTDVVCAWVCAQDASAVEWTGDAEGCRCWAPEAVTP
jgi:hypothetical protein